VNFSTCADMQMFNFPDGHVTTFGNPSRIYVSQTPSHRLSRLAKGTSSESRLSIGTIGLGVKVKPVSCRLCAGQYKGYNKTRKMLFWIWLRRRYKIPEFFTISPVLTSTLMVCRRNRGDPSSLYRTWGCVTSITKNI